MVRGGKEKGRAKQVGASALKWRETRKPAEPEHHAAGGGSVSSERFLFKEGK